MASVGGAGGATRTEA